MGLVEAYVCVVRSRLGPRGEEAETPVAVSKTAGTERHHRHRGF